MKIEVRLKEKDFLRFSVFDVLRRRKRWRAPALFAAILCASAAVCFALRERQGAVFLGVVLLVVAVGLPLAYFLSFFLSVRGQARTQGLNGTKRVYTLELRDDDRGVAMDNGKEHAAYSWERVFHAYRDRDAVYLYITAQRAFLVPGHCVNGGTDSLWALIERRVPGERRTVL